MGMSLLKTMGAWRGNPVAGDDLVRWVLRRRDFWVMLMMTAR